MRFSCLNPLLKESYGCVKQFFYIPFQDDINKGVLFVEF